MPQCSGGAGCEHELFGLLRPGICSTADKRIAFAGPVRFNNASNLGDGPVASAKTLCICFCRPTDT